MDLDALRKEVESTLDPEWVAQYGEDAWQAALAQLGLLAPRDLGGPGSGNFGHAGRPGEVGGSAEGSGAETGSGEMHFHPDYMFEDEVVGNIEARMTADYQNAHHLGYDAPVPLDQIKQNATELGREMLAKAAPVIITPDFVVDKVLEDGRFKSQHESGRSRGSLDPEYRTEAEAAMFGTPTDGPLPDRPIYGTMVEDFGRIERAKQYGDVYFVLKDSVLDRTTVNFGDSLAVGYYAKEVAPQPYKKFDWAGMGTGAGQWQKGQSIDDVYPYAEAQYHGGVTLKDVKEVVVPKSQYDWWQEHGELAKLNAKGIPVRVLAPKTHKARV